MLACLQKKKTGSQMLKHIKEDNYKSTTPKIDTSNGI